MAANAFTTSACGSNGSVRVTPVNLNHYERWASVIGGGALLLYGLNRVPLSAVFLTLIGGGLVSRGITGYCPLCPVEAPDLAGQLAAESDEMAGLSQRAAKSAWRAG